MRRIIAGAALALSIAGCGGEDPGEGGLAVGFRLQALECSTPYPLQARLEVSGVPGVCLLQVGPDGTAEGTCRGVPAGEERVFRLVYYVEDPRVGDAVEVATVSASVDLRAPPARDVRLEFPPALFHPDDDRDGRSNLWEYCNGRDPRSGDCAVDPQPACSG